MSRSPAGAQPVVTFSDRARRALWNCAWLLLYRPTPALLFRGWRCVLLRLFGARIAAGAYPYPSAKIWAPWNLSMGAHSRLGPAVDCYCVSPISIGAHAWVSQYSYLCSAGHDYRDPSMPLIGAPIVIEAEAWVAADVFVGPGVRIGTGAVIGARSTVVRNVEAWTVVAGPNAEPRGRRRSFTR